MPLLLQDLPTPNPTRLLAPVQQREEAGLLRLAIETLHPAATRYLSKGGLEGRGKELEREATYAGDSATWLRAVSRYLAAVRDDRTTVEWSAPVRKYREEHPTHFPFRIAMLGKRAIVTEATRESGIEAGDELLEVEGRHVDDIRRQVANWTSVDGRTDYVKVRKFADDPSLAMGSGLESFGPVFWGMAPIHRFRFRKAGAKQLTGIKLDEWKALRAEPKETVTLTQLPGRVAVLRVDAFVAGTAWPPHFEALRREPGVRLVLDLRRCRGGATEAPMALLRFLCAQPVAWASETARKPAEVPEPLRPYLKEEGAEVEVGTPPQDPLPERFDGPLDVLVGPDNAGEATMFLTRLRANRTVRIIGEPTGGTLEGLSGPAFWTLQLPRSGFVVRIPKIRTETGVKGNGKGIEPDIRMAPKESDLLGKTDTVLDWVVANPPVARTSRVKRTPIPNEGRGQGGGS